MYILGWTALFKSLPNKDEFVKSEYLHRFTEAGNAAVLAMMMTEASSELGHKNEESGNTFLHSFAEKHNLKDLFQELFTYYDDSSQIPFTGNNESLEVKNQQGYTFLAVAVNNVQNSEMEENLVAALEFMMKVFKPESITGLCKIDDNGGSCLLHYAVRKSLIKLVDLLITRTPKADKKRNSDGFNPLHLAVTSNNIEMVKCILQRRRVTEDFNVNSCMLNGETALHIAAQLGYHEIFTELIRKGGDLAATDIEEGHTPLHDCLQQVYFEGGAEDAEKCGKFVTIWNTVVEEAVTWKCLSKDPKRNATCFGIGKLPENAARGGV